MAESWRRVLDELDIATTSAAGPAGAEGEWHQLAAAFGAKAFLRALTDGEALVLECAPPGDVAASRGALSAAGWQVDDDASAPFLARRELPTDADAMRLHWVSIAKLADAVRAEDSSAFHAALEPPAPAAEESTAQVAAQDSADSDSEERGSTPSGGAFESIGDDEALADMEQAFAYAIAVESGAVEVTLGFAEVLEAREFEKLEERLIANLRGKYDVDVKIVGAHEVQSALNVAAKTRVALRVTPAEGTRTFSLSDTEDAVSSYFKTLARLAKSGIDPLVFLGARASKRDTGGFEAIGTAAKVEEAAGDDDSHAMLVDDDEPEPVDESAEEVVFGEAPLDADAPLEPGRYDDERLHRADATTTLVDVVLRHPGYSDRNIGQVMSILLSLDYASCLEIAERSPTVIAWGVSRDRALTMKTVVEGAGGKVVLVEPGTFGED